MVRGIGVDMVEISRIRRILEKGADSPFIRRTFTDAEKREASRLKDPAEYYAARFAAKEAVFKAVGHLTEQKGFDLRIVETLNQADGSPYISMTEQLRPVLENAGVRTVHISITTEGNYACAFVVACDDGDACLF